MLHAELRDRVGAVELDVAFGVGSGSCLALAGPSGAGKTTILRLLAGTRRSGSGSVHNGDRVWLDTATGAWLPPERRRCGYLFQNLALFPHLSAWRNVAYGMSRGARAERRARAHEWLERMAIGDLAEAKPDRLSGGERQRVALARTLASEPSALLLDEPLAALDTRSRAAGMRQLLQLVRSLEIPVVLVTHSFTEAATLGDEIGVMEAGRIVQRGSASDLAGAPASAFVADFTGAVVLTGRARESAGGLTTVELDGGGTAVTRGSASGSVAIAVLPWEITIAAPGPETPESSRNRLPAKIVSMTQLGSRARLGLLAPQPLAAEVTAEAVAEMGLEVGSEVVATWKATATRLIAGV